jgi:Alw26I/Eco31I/Esp3I family type II restriction m6 adenine DNA methyltransferase
MSRTQTIEQCQLQKAEQLISANTCSYAERMRLLEVASALESGASIETYWRGLGIVEDSFASQSLLPGKLNKLIKEANIPFPLAISSLAREPLTLEDQKQNGVFYTDFRIAKLIADKCTPHIEATSTVADLAAGSGILIAAVAIEYKKKFPKEFNQWVATRLFAYDLSENALRGAATAILSLCSDASAVVNMYRNWRVCDSLLDNELDSMQFDIVVGNPPWGKIKITRHNFLKRTGEDRIYGAEYCDFDSKEFQKEKDATLEYSKLIRAKYSLLGESEPDMYMAFLQRAVNAVATGGHISYLIPAGLIRSKGTSELREYLLQNTSCLLYELLDNKERYFSIDTRFKFLLLSCRKGQHKSNLKLDKFSFRILSSNPKSEIQTITFSVKDLRRIRPDLTIPELRNNQEKQLFEKMYLHGRMWGNTGDEWHADISREVDMTNDRKYFVSKKEADSLPVVEGRMVQQHRFGAKCYVSGSGRSATWDPCHYGCVPQFYIPRKHLSEHIRKRVSAPRAGYCDIAGQTNERAMMSAIIPSNVVCGNKVPTVVFPNDPTGDRIYLWVGIVNSFAFDWLIRRIISTTVNYFLLLSVPIPQIELDSNLAKTIISCTKRLSCITDEYYRTNEMQVLRIRIEVAVAKAYGLSLADICLILQDFPLYLNRTLPKRTRRFCNRHRLLYIP